jgi:hypothetical protein
MIPKQEHMMAQSKYGISSIGTVGAFLKGRACSDTLFHVLNRAFDEPMKTEERAALPLAGGLMQHGYQCGMIWGAALAAGAQAYRLFGPGAQAETRAIAAARGLVEVFRARNNTINCHDITNLDASSTNLQMINYFLIKGGAIGCFRRTARYAPAAFSAIDAAFSENHGEAPSAPVSCAALLARKMGAGDNHAVMAAGLAGGIGLCGGGCGALGTAIWIIGMNSIRNGSGKIEFQSPPAIDAIDRFTECTDFKFECSAIIGRRFTDTADHAGYVQAGGCAGLIEVLASA